MKTISVLSHKGGTGKTSLTHAFAAILTKKYGKKVLLIDADGQANLSLTLNADLNDLGLADVLLGDSNVQDALQHTEYGDLLSGDSRLYAVNVQLASDPERGWKLADALEPLRDKYDYIFIDCPPGQSIITTNAVLASDSILLPLSPDPYSLQGLGLLHEMLEEYKELTDPFVIPIEGIILNKFDRRPRVNRSVREAALSLADEFKTTVYDTTIRPSVKITEAQAEQKALIDFASKSPIEKDLEALVEEFIECQI